MPVHFDTADVATRIREKSAALREAALAEAADNSGHRRFVEAQHALIDAIIVQSQVLVELSGAGMPAAEIIKVFAAHSSNILSSLLNLAPPENSEAREAILALFVTNLLHCVTGGTGHRGTIEVRGQKGGRA